MKSSFFSINQTSWNLWCKQFEVSEHLGELLLRRYWKNQNFTIPSWAQEQFEHSFHLDLPEIVSTQESIDGTAKFLLQFQDGQRVEMVAVPFPGRYTLCLSTQVGCGMGCRFCFTAQQGLKRNLLAQEIIGQYIVGASYLKGRYPQIKNSPKIVFMGQGEPLHNFDELKLSLDIFLDPKRLALGPRSITISTVGYLPGLKRLKELPTVNLALSLHSPFDEQRSKLIPINQRYPLKEILPYLENKPRLRKQYINFEYLLIKDFNDSIEHALALKDLLLDKPGIINIIPYNFVPGLDYIRPSFDEAHEFQKTLRRLGIYATVRTTKGEEIMAACGQLSSKSKMVSSPPHSSIAVP